MTPRSKEFITLKEAADISGYTSDYLGQLIRGGKLEGKQVFSNVSWVTTEDALRRYMDAKEKGMDTTQKNTLTLAFSPEFLDSLQGAIWWLALLVCGFFFLALFYIFAVSVDRNLSGRYTPPAPEELGVLEINPRGL